MEMSKQLEQLVADYKKKIRQPWSAAKKRRNKWRNIPRS